MPGWCIACSSIHVTHYRLPYGFLVCKKCTCWCSLWEWHETCLVSPLRISNHFLIRIGSWSIVMVLSAAAFGTAAKTITFQPCARPKSGVQNIRRADYQEDRKFEPQEAAGFQKGGRKAIESCEQGYRKAHQTIWPVGREWSWDCTTCATTWHQSRGKFLCIDESQWTRRCEYGILGGVYSLPLLGLPYHVL